jgi:ribonuclease BN (tRNA processing enzyme)
MKITFLGTSHGIAESDRFCSSAVVTVGSSNYIIDAGAPISTLYTKYGFDFADLKGIFITHSHSDHFAGLVEFTFQMTGFGRYKGLHIPIYVPDDKFCYRIEEFVNLTEGGGDSKKNADLEYRIYPDGEIFNDGNVKITAVPVEHCQNAHAFIIEGEGKRVCFTGDMKGDLRDYPKQIFEEEFDLVVTEGAHQTLNKPEIIERLSRSRTKAMYINHIYDKKNPPEAVAELAEAVKDKFSVTVAADGMIVEI